MSVLSNARWELFAQSVANGKLLDDAYADAGYKPNQRNSSRLRKLTSVDERIAELLNERASKIVEKVAIEVEYTREKLLAKLEKAYEVAQKAKNGSAMTMSVIGMARICGLIIDRREVGEVGAFSSYTDEQLLQEGEVGAFSSYTDEQLLQEAMERARRLGSRARQKSSSSPRNLVKNRPQPGSGSGCR